MEERDLRFNPNHPPDLIIGEPTTGIKTRSSFNKDLCALCIHSDFISEIEPKNIDIALGEESWVMAMHEELNQFVRNNVWNLVPRPTNYPVVGTKWVYKNKHDES